MGVGLGDGDGDGVGVGVAMGVGLGVAVGVGDGDFTLRPGDVFTTEGTTLRSVPMEVDGDCRLIHLDASVPLNPSGTHGSIEDSEPYSDRPPLFRRMYRGHDGVSYLRRFEALFADRSGTLSDARECSGFSFSSFETPLVLDWHPEVLNQLVVVLSGEVELEVGGGEEKVCVFRRGDVVLAEDRTGEGHIDRLRGDLRLLVMVIDDQELW